MTILVIGATGRVGRHVVDQLIMREADVRVLTRDPAKAAFPAGVEVVQGDLLDIDGLRAALPASARCADRPAGAALRHRGVAWLSGP